MKTYHSLTGTNNSGKGNLECLVHSQMIEEQQEGNTQFIQGS